MKRVTEYTAPAVEVLAVAVEQGFSGSFGVDKWGNGGEEEGEAE